MLDRSQGLGRGGAAVLRVLKRLEATLRSDIRVAVRSGAAFAGCEVWGVLARGVASQSLMRRRRRFGPKRRAERALVVAHGHADNCRTGLVAPIIEK